MAIEWDRIGQPGFDRIVEALVHRMYDASASVEAVNGRGGDAGIDIKVTSGSRVRIFQLKYYPDGFPTGSYKGRRPSVKESFSRAMAHSPWEWVLVVPCTLTTPEREFTASLAAGQGVRVRVWDRAKLDGLMATHADLEASFTRNQLYDAAKVFGQEQAMLMGGLPDVHARVEGLGRQVDGLDDHWTVDFARQGETVVQTLRGKHPRAHEISPVEFTVTGNGPWDPELTAAVRRSLGFGVPEEVVLPREAVQSLTVRGPEWLSGDHRDIEVRWRPVVAVPPGERGWMWSSSTGNRSPPPTWERWGIWAVAASAARSMWSCRAGSWSCWFPAGPRCRRRCVSRSRWSGWSLLRRCVCSGCASAS